MDESCIPFFAMAELGCNHCHAARNRLKDFPHVAQLESLVHRVAARGGGEFDCVIGVSGGLDSSYLVAKAVELGLRPLAVHMDNNWNSSMASRNIRRLLEKLDVPLVTVVTDWETQRRLQLAFLSSDVVDVELLYDNALHAVCYSVAKSYGIKTILGGANNATEGVEIPDSWVTKKFDGANIKSIARDFGAKYSGYPIFTGLDWLWNTLVRRIEWLSLLDSMPEYGRETALDYLMKNYGYTPYGSKHYENVFTRFYQGHILPTKFGIDKRRPHFSSEIVSGTTTREEAMAALDQPIYESAALLELDYAFIRDKLRLSQDEMSAYLSRPPRRHDEYHQDFFLHRVIPRLLTLRRAVMNWST